MNRSTTKKWIATLLVAMLTVLGLGQTMVHAVDGENPVPPDFLTDVIITKVETSDAAKDMTLEQLKDGVDVATYFTDGKVLPGVSFTWFSVTDSQLTTMKADPMDFDTVAEVEAIVGVGSGTATAETNASGQVTIPNLPKGNYWVVENAKGTITSARAVPFGLILPFTNLTGDGFLRAINVYPKNTLTDDEPDIEKTVDEVNVAIGDLNTWTVSLDIPVGIEDYDKFSFYDILDSRLDYVGVSSVTAAGITLNINTDYTVNVAGSRLDVVFTENGRIKLANATSDKVDIKIETRVNESAIMGQEIPNTATLEFNNGHGVDKSKTPGTIPSVHTGGKAFVKKDQKNGTGLKDAEFKIKNGQGLFVNIGAAGVVTFGNEADATVFKSDANGKLEVRGLPYGEYVLVETKAPQGYALPTDPNTDFTVSATSYHSNPTDIVVGQEPDADVIKTINNRKLVIPQTGGIGTALFTILGALTMLLSVVFYRRTNKA